MKDIGLSVVKQLLRRKPRALANIKGSDAYPELQAEVMFYQTMHGVFCITEAWGLPEQSCGSGVFGMHIHNGSSCTGNIEDSFADAGMHYNPGMCPHPYHAGDLPPLFGDNGVALCAVLTDRFTVDEVIGKTVIIHASPDDFTTQPSGNSGAKIGCGVIYRNL